MCNNTNNIVCITGLLLPMCCASNKANNWVFRVQLDGKASALPTALPQNDRCNITDTTKSMEKLHFLNKKNPLQSLSNQNDSIYSFDSHIFAAQIVIP